MGAWGIGLYASDFALDLRATIKGVARLPFAPDQLLDTIRATEGNVPDDPNNPDHTIFWLTVADQFAKRGIDCPSARDRALAIIGDGTDLETMAALGMDERSLAKRRIKLEELRVSLIAPMVPKARTVLKAPQKLVVELGDVLSYPTCKGAPINPYAVGKEWAWVKAWKRDGWGLCVIVERGLVFDFLAWYRPLVVHKALAERPDFALAQDARVWRLKNPGTLSARHFDALQMNRLGEISVDAVRLDHAFPKRISPVSCAVSDISLANGLNVEPPEVQAFEIHEAHRIKHGHPATPRIESLAEVTV